MGMTMTQKILAKHAGKDSVDAGDLILVELDRVLGNDITSPVAIKEFEKIGDAKPVSYALRYAASFPEVFMVLSGMGNMEMMESNLKTMHPFVPLNQLELETTDKVRNIIREYNQIPCTKCKYCAEVCPKIVQIADLFSVYNEYALAHITKSTAKEKFLEFEIKASDCIECGKCEKICPQNIEIREKLKTISKM